MCSLRVPLMRSRRRIAMPVKLLIYRPNAGMPTCSDIDPFIAVFGRKRNAPGSACLRNARPPADGSDGAPAHLRLERAGDVLAVGLLVESDRLAPGDCHDD